jgi:hypothetical protein
MKSLLVTPALVLLWTVPSILNDETNIMNGTEVDSEEQLFWPWQERWLIPSASSARIVVISTALRTSLLGGGL